MQFIDRAQISVQAGNGGDGKTAFRREKFVPRGGPAGGDGGRGADVILEADANLNTLLKFRFRRKFAGERGEHGETKNMYGANAQPLVITVPPGTLVKDSDTGELLADLTTAGQRVLVAKGGRGGRGNSKFQSSRNRVPTMAELGEPGEGRNLSLELKLLADVGLVGYPSVGKSSLIARVSAARPEIAEYHFTTLTPVLGVVRVDEDRSFVMADIPGLIDGAADGLGLGHDFLRHVERCKLILHVLDASGCEGRDPVDDYRRINSELRRYSEKLSRRPQIIVANKVDLPTANEHLPQLRDLAARERVPLLETSAATKSGLAELVQTVASALDNCVEEPDAEPADAAKLYDTTAMEEGDRVTVTRNDAGEFIVHGKDLERLVAMTHFDNDEALRRFQHIWKRRNLDALLRGRGIAEGQTVHIGDMTFEYHE